VFCSGNTNEVANVSLSVALEHVSSVLHVVGGDLSWCEFESVGRECVFVRLLCDGGFSAKARIHVATKTHKHKRNGPKQQQLTNIAWNNTQENTKTDTEKEGEEKTEEEKENKETQEKQEQTTKEGEQKTEEEHKEAEENKEEKKETNKQPKNKERAERHKPMFDFAKGDQYQYIKPNECSGHCLGVEWIVKMLSLISRVDGGSVCSVLGRSTSLDSFLDSDLVAQYEPDGDFRGRWFGSCSCVGWFDLVVDGGFVVSKQKTDETDKEEEKQTTTTRRWVTLFEQATQHTKEQPKQKNTKGISTISISVPQQLSRVLGWLFSAMVLGVFVRNKKKTPKQRESVHRTRKKEKKHTTHTNTTTIGTSLPGFGEVFVADGGIQKRGTVPNTRPPRGASV